MMQQKKFKYDPTIKESPILTEESLKITKNDVVILGSKNGQPTKNDGIEEGHKDGLVISKTENSANCSRLNPTTVQMALHLPRDNNNSVLLNTGRVETIKNEIEKVHLSNHNINVPPLPILKNIDNGNSTNAKNKDVLLTHKEKLKAKLATKRNQMVDKLDMDIKNQKNAKEERTLIFPTSFRFKMPPKMLNAVKISLQTDNRETLLQSEHIRNAEFQEKEEIDIIDNVALAKSQESGSNTLKNSNVDTKHRRLTFEDYNRMIVRISDIDLSDKTKFACSPASAGKIIQLTIIRDKSGIMNKLFPVFHIVFSVE
jgi:hypothetical protein